MQKDGPYVGFDFGANSDISVGEYAQIYNEEGGLVLSVRHR